MEGWLNGRLFEMNIRSIAKQTNTDKAYLAKNARTWDEWHWIFGHLQMGSVKMLKEKQMVDSMEVNTSIPPTIECQPCIITKQHVKPFPKESSMEITEIRDLTVCDVWGTQAIGGEQYFITFTDGKSRHSMIYFMKHKSEAFTHFKRYKSFVKTQIGHKLKKF